MANESLKRLIHEFLDENRKTQELILSSRRADLEMAGLTHMLLRHLIGDEKSDEIAEKFHQDLQAWEALNDFDSIISNSFGMEERQ